MEGFCEHGSECSSFIKCWEVEWLHNCRLLKQDSAPRVSMANVRRNVGLFNNAFLNVRFLCGRN
jgi:hypothetical protein